MIQHKSKNLNTLADLSLSWRHTKKLLRECLYTNMQI